MAVWEAGGSPECLLGMNATMEEEGCCQLDTLQTKALHLQLEREHSYSLQMIQRLTVR